MGQISASSIDEVRSSTFSKVFPLIKIPIIISWLITPVRFSLELMGVPEEAIFLIGILWLTLGLSIYWGVKLKTADNSYLLLLLSLVVFSPISRIPVTILWWLDTTYNLGTHYGFFFESFTQALLNQLGYGSLIQIIPGFLLGCITIAFLNYKKPVAQ